MPKNTTATSERYEPLTDHLVGALAAIAQMGGIDAYVRVPAYFAQGTHGRLKYWGLLEPDLTAGMRSGRWKVTGLGVQFLRGQVELKEFAVVSNDRVIRFEGRKGKLSRSYLPDPAPSRMDEILAGILADR